jgi:NADH-quinone oxidoreductase subunit G
MADRPMVSVSEEKDLVNVKIDGVSVSVPVGINLIEAARLAGVEVPHYCYHRDLSVAGNCRMCQVEVVGAPKLQIACNTVVKDGLEFNTHISSAQVKDAQAATLEFILINHPLDCTVCDQAGHCKLQDYHYEYNARPSRFIEDKVNKVKAFPLGKTVVLDGERCISCTRCVRFCDEVTGTSELGLINRGDRSVITVNPEYPLDNPLSGTVVDLCPVGALTHRHWRFNTRIWFTKQTDSICPGCSTGCNIKVCERDGKVVLVKGRYNEHVNKEWLCDEGRYGMDRFLPEARLITPLLRGQAVSWEKTEEFWRTFGKEGKTLVLCSPNLMLEDYALIKEVCDQMSSAVEYVTQYRERPLTPVEKVLISPDYAPNFRGAQLMGVASGNCEREYLSALERVRQDEFSNILICGDSAIAANDLDAHLIASILKANAVVCISASVSPLTASSLAIPIRTVLERSGLMVNRAMRLQYVERVVPAVESAEPLWRWFARLKGDKLKDGVLSSMSTDREATIALLSSSSVLETSDKRRFKIADIKKQGVDLSGLL